MSTGSYQCDLQLKTSLMFCSDCRCNSGEIEVRCCCCFSFVVVVIGVGVSPLLMCDLFAETQYRTSYEIDSATKFKKAQRNSNKRPFFFDRNEVPYCLPFVSFRCWLQNWFGSSYNVESRYLPPILLLPRFFKSLYLSNNETTRQIDVTNTHTHIVLAVIYWMTCDFVWHFTSIHRKIINLALCIQMGNFIVVRCTRCNRQAEQKNMRCILFISP